VAEVAKGIIDIEINTGSAAAQLKALQQQINSFSLAINKGNAYQAQAMGKYSTELKDIINSSRFFTAETVKMQTAAGALDSTLKKGRGTLSQYFSARFNKNSALFAETMGLASERARSMQTQFIATSGAANGMQEALAIRPISAFNGQLAIAAQKSQILTQMFRQGTTQLVNFGKNVQWAGRQLMVGFTLPLTVFGTAAGKTFMELEKQVVNFRKVYGDLFTTPRELEENIQAVTELANEYTKYGIAVKDTIGLAAEAAAAGRTNKELIDAVTQATRLSTLGQMDQAQALETTIALQSAFRLSGQDLADTINFLNMVENQTVVTLQDLAAAIPRVAPVIKGLGGDVQDMAVFLAAMQEGGVSAEQGANALKSGLASLINPTKQAKDMLGDFNINLDAIIQKNRGDLMGTVTDFAKVLQTLDEFSRQQVLEQVFGKFQYARLGALFENIVRDGSQANQVLQTTTFSSEQLAQTAEKELGAIEQSLGVQLTSAVEKFKLAMAPIGELFVQLAIPVVNFATKIIEAFNNLPDFQKKFIAFATIITGLIVPAGTMFIGLLMNLGGQILKIMQMLGLFTKGIISKGGIVGGIKAVTQSMKYMSLSEIDAAISARQLTSATQSTSEAFLRQVRAAETAKVAVRDLGNTYKYLITRMMEASALATTTLGTAGTALNISKGKIPKKFAKGGVVPGTGNSDTVPAMLMPGEFVVTKDATRTVGQDFLSRLNSGGAVGLNDGTPEGLLRNQQMAREVGSIVSKPVNTQSSAAMPSAVSLPDFPQGTQRAHTTAGIQKTLTSDLTTVRGTLPAGSVVEELSNRVLNLGTKINQRLRANSKRPVSGKELLKNINSNRSTIFTTMDKQFASYLDNEMQSMKNSGASEQSINSRLSTITKEYNKEKAGILKRYTRVLGMYPNASIRDAEFAKISNFAFKKFAQNKNIAPFHDELVKSGSVRMSKAQLAQTAKNLGIEVAKRETRKSLVAKIESKTGAKLPEETKRGQTMGYAGSKYHYERFDKSPIKLSKMLMSRFGLFRRLKMNKGGEVPSLLTPGEYVVNSKAARANRPFLDALNAGEVKGFENGTEPMYGPQTRREAAASRLENIRKVNRRGSFASGVSRVGGIAGRAALPGLIAGQALSMSSNQTAAKFGQVTSAASGVLFGLQILEPLLPRLANPVGLLITAFAGTAALAIITSKQMKELNDSSAAMTRAMYGGADNIKNFAEAYGRQTFAQQEIALASQMAGGAKTEESKQFSTQFMQGEEGQKLLESVKKVRDEGGDAVLSLRNQLAQAVVTGLITPEDAKAIAEDVGIALDDQQLAVSAIGKINSLFGPNGERLKDNTMSIIAEITPDFNLTEINAQAEQAYNEDNGFFAKLFGDKESQIEGAASADIAQRAAIATENYANALAKARLEYRNGDRSLEDYNQTVEEYGKVVKQTSDQSVAAFAKNIGVATSELEELSKKTTVVGGKGFAKVVPTKQAKEIQDFFKAQRVGVEGILTGLGDKTSQELIDGVIDFAGGEGAESAGIFSQMITGTLDESMINQIIEFLNSQGLNAAAIAFRNKFKISPMSQADYDFLNGLKGINGSGGAGDGGSGIDDLFGSDGGGEKEKSKIETLEESIKQTNDYTKAIRYLVANGIRPEALATLDAATAIEIMTKKRSKLIEKINDQATKQRLISTLMLSADEKRIRVLELQNNYIGRQVSEIEKQISVVDRLNELDQRQISRKQKALDELSKKEDKINKEYDARITALDKVAKANDRVAQSEQDRISLASALSSGDIAAAASAANQMSSNFAQTQIEDTRTQLEEQRQREIESLTVSINGQMLTRSQIEAQIDVINERIYQRNLATIPLQDQIYNLEEERRKKQEEIELIQDGILAKQIEQELNMAKQDKKLKGLVGHYRSMYNYQKAIADGDFSRSASEVQNAAFGGKIKRMAFGGLLKYTSNESPPGMMMGGKVKRYAFGNIVPGLGNTDRVPALLTPGEFVVRKSVAQENMPLLKALNGDIFPRVSGSDLDSGTTYSPVSTSNITNMPVYNNYSVNVNVPNVNASPEEIANTVISRLRRTASGDIRGTRRI